MAATPTPPKRDANDRAIAWGCAALIVAAVGGVYWNSLNGPFIFDDHPAVVRNATIRDLSQLGAVLSPPLDGAGVTGRPLVNLSYALNHALHGTAVRGYHAGSILLHALGSLALFGVLRRAFRLPSLRPQWGEGATVRAAGLALLWAVHPLLTESVVCIAQRNEVLVGLFYLLTFYGFTRATEDGGEGEARWLAVSAAACWLGMASKEVMATAPLLVVTFDRIFVAGSWTELWRQRKFYYAGLFGAWVLLAWLMVGTQQRAGIVGFGLGMSAWDYLVTQGRAVTTYLRLSIWPHPLVADYGAATYPLREVWAEGAAVVGLLVATGWALWRHPRAGFFGAWFFVILAPSSSFVPLTTQTIAEHRMYLPLVAVVAGLALFAERFARRWFPWLAAGAALILGAVTVHRNSDYLDVEHLWQLTLSQRPGNARAHASLGYHYMQNRRWPEAIAAYERALALQDNYPDAHSDLCALLLEVGRTGEALEHARTAVALKPADPVLRFNYGLALERAGDRAGALREWEEVRRLQPGENLRQRMDAVIQRRLGDSALQAGQAAEAADHFARAVAVEPMDMESWAGWGQALTQLGRLPEAVERFRAALNLTPAVPELHYNLGNVWLEMGRLAKAEASLAEAVRLKPGFALARHNLALALVRSGRPAEALPHYAKVTEAMPDSALVRLNFALALAQAGRSAEAAEQAGAALRLEPDLREARDLLLKLRSKN